MRKVLTAVAAIAASAFFASSAVQAQTYYAGGPVQQGNMCQVSTGGDQYYGYWRPCPQPTVTKVTLKKKRHAK
jgi:hypothetical protein